MDLAVRRLARLTIETEQELRTMLRLSLEPTDGPREPLLLRQGRAIQWLEEALSPLRGTLTDVEFRRLVLAIRASCGIEALVWLIDVAALSRPEAVKLMRWSARALLRSSLEANQA